MQKKLIARTAKLLSESKRSRRHQGIAIAYEHIPNDVDERNHGSIYALVNVNAPSASAEEVAEIIVDAFFGEYYQDLSKDPLASFESALARVNEELADVTHHGNIHWLNNIHAILAVHTGDAIHLTQTGKAEAYLYRNGKSSHITRDLSGDSINPLRTFINIASGELLEGDKVVLVTPGVFYHISKDELQRYVEEFQPKVAISHLADLLEGNSTEMQPNSILILESITPEAASEETLVEINDEVWLSEPNRPVETAIEKSAPFIQKTIFYTRKGLRALTTFTTATAWPWIKEKTTKSYEYVVGLFAKDDYEPLDRPTIKTKGNHIESPKETIEVSERDTHIDDLNIHEHSNSFVDDTKTSTGVIHIKETRNKPKWLKLEKIDFSHAGKIKDIFGDRLKRAKKNKRSLLVVAIGLTIILFISVFSIWKIRENTENQKLAEASYTEAESKLAIGKNESASGDKTKAAETLNSALSITDSLKSNKKLKDQATSLESQILTALDTALSVTRVNPTKLADVKNITSDNAFGPYLVGKSLYLINKDNGNIAAVSVSNGESSNVLDNPKIDGKITAATSVPVRSTIVLYTDTGNIYEFDTKDLSLIKQAVSGDMENTIAMASFSTNIYTLGNDGQIYKRTKTSIGYSARSTYISDGSNVNGAVSIAIDSNIYVLKPNDEVIQYLGGEKQDYSINNSPITMKDASFIFTNEDTKGIYISESNEKRVIRVDANGKYIGEYLSDNFAGISGVYVDDANTKIYAFANGTLYQFAQ